MKSGIEKSTSALHVACRETTCEDLGVKSIAAPRMYDRRISSRSRPVNGATRTRTLVPSACALHQLANSSNGMVMPPIRPTSARDAGPMRRKLRLVIVGSIDNSRRCPGCSFVARWSSCTWLALISVSARIIEKRALASAAKLRTLGSISAAC